MVGLPSPTSASPGLSRAFFLGFLRLKQRGKYDLVHLENLVLSDPPSAMIYWYLWVSCRPWDQLNNSSRRRGGAPGLPSRQTSITLFSQAEKPRKSRPRHPFRSPKFGVDQRRLLKHSGSSSVRPNISHCAGYSRPPWTVFCLASYTDDATWNPQGASTPHGIQLANLLCPMV